MNWFLLLLGLVSAGLTYNVRHPIQRGFRARAFGFFAGWLWGELAPHIIAVQVLLVVAFAAGGAIEGFAGVVGLLLVAGSCGVLANIYLESGKAGAIVERALRDGLGDSYEEAIDADLRAKFERGVRVRPLLLPFSFTRPEVETIKDIRFAREKGVDLKLDIARHRMVPEKSPVLLQIHGGGWTIGYKENQAVPLMTQLASRGWVCVNVDYRLSPHATFPEHLIDCKMAIKWIRENIERYGGDPDFIVATGGSAGGHLSAMVGLTANAPEYQPGFEDVDTSVHACVPFYGVYDMANRYGFHDASGLTGLLEQSVFKGSYEEIPDAYHQASPLDRVHADAPPFLIIHGRHDSLVPVEEGRVFAEHLRRIGTAPTLYVELEQAQHAFDVFHCLRTQHTVDGVERFVQHVYSAYRAEQRQGDSPAGSGARSKTSAKTRRKREAPLANGKDDSASATHGRIARLPRAKPETRASRAVKSKSAAPVTPKAGKPKAEVRPAATKPVTTAKSAKSAKSGKSGKSGKSSKRPASTRSRPKKS
jgi:acetyl esterase/lipase